MTGSPHPWTRRQFSQAVAASAASSLVGCNRSRPAPAEASDFAFVGSSGPSPSTHAIHVFQANGSRWTPIQTLAAPAPTHLEPHPTLPVLYAVHAVDLWQHLPRGAISAYSIAPSGKLTLLNTQPLSLSATHPRHAAVSPDGRYLAVAGAGGGLYNILPLASDGMLEPPTAIRKELGLLNRPNARASTPRQILFHPNGANILTADTCQETISSFDYDHDSISLRNRTRTHPGAGASQIALSGNWLYAQHATDGSIAAHRLTPEHLLPPSYLHATQAPGPALMTMHHSGAYLVTANAHTLTSLSIDPATGRLQTIASIPSDGPLRALSFSPEGTHLFGIGASSGHIFSIPFNPASGTLTAPKIVAQVQAAASVLFRLA